MKNIRVYADTSVYGGIFDDEFSRPSKDFFAQVHKGRFDIITSSVVAEEISRSPQRVQDSFDEMLSFAEVVEINQESINLQKAFI